jgi:hypothetical protein
LMLLRLDFSSPVAMAPGSTRRDSVLRLPMVALGMPILDGSAEY